MIRKATIQDIPRIAEIIVFGKRVAYRPIFNDDNGTFNDLQVIHIIKEYQNNSVLIDNMIVYDDGIIKGVINRIYTDDSMELCEFYVEPFFKGMGIGKAMIQYAVSGARTANIKRIFLWVIKDNFTARRFYEANGFEESGETRMIEGTDKIDMCYELLLK